MEQLEAFPVATGVGFTLQGNGFGSSARIEAHSHLDPRALEEVLSAGLLRAEWDGDRLRYRRHYANPLRAYNAALHIRRIDQRWRPSLFATAPETCIEVDRLFTDLPTLSWARARKLMVDAMPFCAVCQNDHRELLEVHHIHGRSGVNPHRLTNLITLCRNCHRRADRGTLGISLEHRWVEVVDANNFPSEYR